MQISHKTLACPNCKRQLRVPLKPGKILRITCPDCSCQFDISFKNPLSDLFQWNKKISLLGNFKNAFQNFQKLPAKIKLVIILFIVSVIYFSVSMYMNSQPKSIIIPELPIETNTLL